MNGITASRLRRTAAAVSARRWAIGCVCLLVVAAALRFYNLSDGRLRYDEAVAAVNSRGTVSEVVERTRHENSSPILYPLALWAVQKAASTELSVRVLPAAASLLTVGALLFLMPRVGVPRRAAFLAALLAALSPAAIEHAQDAREYSVDALLAALMIAGLLQYLRDGRKALLCAALFVGPLLQYGLALFGVGVIGAAAVAGGVSSQARGGGRRAYGAAAVWRWLTGRGGLLLPIACFAAACALSWWVTGRYQWTAGGWAGGAYESGARGAGYYLEAYYYQGGYDAAAMAQFAISRTWDMVSYHMPPIVAGAALLAFGGLLLSLALRRRMDAVAVLALFGVGIAICAALLSAYPYGAIRHSLYLEPIIFLAAGAAFHSLGVDAAALARRERVAPALGIAAACVIALAGAAAIWRDDLYNKGDSVERLLAMQEEREREGDAVYVYRWAVPSVEFYKGEKPDNYFYEQTPCLTETYASSTLDCVPDALDEMFRELGGARRIWLIHNAGVSAPKEIAAYSREAVVEEIAVDGMNALHLITDFGDAAANIRERWLAVYDAVASEAPSAAADYNLYLRDNALYYTKRPCAAADTEAKFFLHIYPMDAAELTSDRRRRSGFNNLDFDFPDYGFRADDRCVIRRTLPKYPIERIHTGQFINPNGPVVWEAGLRFKR